MKFIKNFIELCRDEDGATTIEYMLMATVVAGAALAASGLVTTKISGYTFTAAVSG
jgi:Flp pilus assembly pilin Flp